MKKAKDLPFNFGIKMQVYPSSTQKRIINKNIDFARFYWNKLVWANKEIAKLRHNSSLIRWPWANTRIEQLKQIADPNGKYLKQVYTFANDKELDSTALMQTKANYQASWNLYKKVKSVHPPTFHKKHDFGSYQTSNKYTNPQQIDRATIFNGNICFLDDSHIKLPKIGRIRVSFSQKRYLRLKEMCYEGGELRLTKATISRDACGSYYVSFQIASDVRIRGDFDKTGSKIGIDLNLDNFLTDSNGNVVDNPRFYRQAKKQLAKAQRKLGKRCARARKENRSLRNAKKLSETAETGCQNPAKSTPTQECVSGRTFHNTYQKPRFGCGRRTQKQKPAEKSRPCDVDFRRWVEDFPVHARI